MHITGKAVYEAFRNGMCISLVWFSVSYRSDFCCMCYHSHYSLLRMCFTDSIQNTAKYQPVIIIHHSASQSFNSYFSLLLEMHKSSFSFFSHE